MQKLISVIIPVYNAESYISRSIDSISSQDYRNIEIIIIDDGSTDSTKEIVTAMSDNRIRYYYQINAGVSAARNYGISVAKGDYIIFADADDTYFENSFSKMVQILETSHAELACFGYRFDNKSIKKTDFIISDSFISRPMTFSELSVFLGEVPNAPWGKVFLRSIVEAKNIRFDVNVPYAEDTIFLLNYIAYIDKIVLSSDVVYYYNVSPGEIQASNKFYPKICEYFSKVMKAKELYCNQKNTVYDKDTDNEIYLKKIIDHRVFNNNFVGFQEDVKFLNADIDLKKYIKKSKRSKMIRIVKDTILLVYRKIMRLS